MQTIVPGVTYPPLLAEGGRGLLHRGPRRRARYRLGDGRVKKILATSLGLAYLAEAMQHLPEITVNSKIALIFRGKLEQWTIKQIVPHSEY